MRSLFYIWTIILCFGWTFFFFTQVKKRNKKNIQLIIRCQNTQNTSETLTSFNSVSTQNTFNAPPYFSPFFGSSFKVLVRTLSESLKNKELLFLHDKKSII